jgi:hypothetical protein
MPTAWLMRRNSRLSAVRNIISIYVALCVPIRQARTLRAPCDELAAILEEVARHFEELLCLVHRACGCAEVVVRDDATEFRRSRFFDQVYESEGVSCVQSQR